MGDKMIVQKLQIGGKTCYYEKDNIIDSTKQLVAVICFWTIGEDHLRG